MTPKEKANELYNKYAVFWHDTTETCKQQCLILVDEVLSIFILQGSWRKKAQITFWKEVKEEIQKL